MCTFSKFTQSTSEVQSSSLHAITEIPDSPAQHSGTSSVTVTGDVNEDCNEVKLKSIINVLGGIASKELLPLNYKTPLYETLRDAGLRGIWETLVVSSFDVYSLSDAAFPVTRDLRNRDLGYSIALEALQAMWRRMKTIGALVVCAANGLDSLGIKDCPLSIPDDLFTSREWHTMIPYVDPVTHARQYFPICAITDPSVSNPFIYATFPTREYARMALESCDIICTTLTKWAEHAINRSLDLGRLSLANFGALFFLVQEEFLRRLRPTNFDDRYPDHQLSSGRNSTSAGKELILHPLYSSAVRQGYLGEYDPLQPGFCISAYAPSGRVTRANEGFGWFKEYMEKDEQGRAAMLIDFRAWDQVGRDELLRTDEFSAPLRLSKPLKSGGVV
ncbi:hypothetical protein AAF712_016344 [Marasmius tenuissimus]|uniref:Uncharacterized protein n=1 Tax=Marasmius tenuissimus TaxID=585030 RepID=A0ABR2Z5Y8_9AGAR